MTHPCLHVTELVYKLQSTKLHSSHCRCNVLLMLMSHRPGGRDHSTPDALNPLTYAPALPLYFSPTTTGRMMAIRVVFMPNVGPRDSNTILAVPDIGRLGIGHVIDSAPDLLLILPDTSRCCWMQLSECCFECHAGECDVDFIQ